MAMMIRSSLLSAMERTILQEGMQLILLMTLVLLMTMNLLPMSLLESMVTSPMMLMIAILVLILLKMMVYFVTLLKMLKTCYEIQVVSQIAASHSPVVL